MDKISTLEHFHLSISDDDINWGLYVRSAGKSRVCSSAVEPELYRGVRLMPRGRILSHYQISMIISGGMIYYTGNRNLKLEPGNVIISYPGISHRYHSDPDKGLEEIWVSFNGYYMDMLLKKNFFPNDILRIPSSLNTRLLCVFHSILDMASRQGLKTQKQLSSHLLDLLSILRISMLALGSESHSASLVEKAIGMMHCEIGANLDSAYFADKLNISLPHFRRVFKQTSGIPPHLFFQKLKIQKAKELLESNLTVKDTSLRLGFEDQCYFSRIFKKDTGVSPGKYRDSLTA